ncbi:hypothetical protein N658DRAFT_489084 [Parathielavia hyrcaniae]|uniref:Uncharacterized protein n=1 Tax=Parathielavia hyrcaniae TaxID=113614 RepID=A0AAN6SXK3_9PEZI|nr:hypothetical protein N658DRAFT_489084 [Parathielavia hyrcaniae]
MRYLPNLKVYITVETATAIGLSFVAASSYIFHSVMAKRKKSGVSKPPQPTASASTSATSPVDGNGLAQAEPAVPAAPVTQEVDTRPETSPYGSHACTMPFASPLTLPLDILKKNPKLYAAYESCLPELQGLPEDVGHVIVHFLHTGAYESLKPKQTDAVAKQICELKTSIQAYAAARAYDLPDLMRLAEAQIAKNGDGLPLPAMLEVARDAYPTLTEADGWFLDYLQSRIRPHLQDPTTLLGSDTLDQISSIISPNRVLLRTLLELFCERIAVRTTEPVASPPTANLAPGGAITDPGNSKPVSPLPSALSRKDSKGTPWPSPDNVASSPPVSEAQPMPIPHPVTSSLAPLPEWGPVILDVVSPPGPAIEAKTADEKEANSVPASEVKVRMEPESETDDRPEPETQLPEKPEVRTAVEAEAMTTAEPEMNQEKDRAIPDPAPSAQLERKDPGKAIDLEEAPCKEPESIPEPIPELETGATNRQSHVQGLLLREADSGFWDGPDVMDSGKELAPSLVEVESTVAVQSSPDKGSAHELETGVNPRHVFGVDTRDFAALDKQTPPEPEPAGETVPVSVSARKLVSEATAEIIMAEALDPEPGHGQLPIKVAQEATIADITVAAQNKELEAQPETEKVRGETVKSESMAKPEPETEPEPEPEPVPAEKFKVDQRDNSHSAIPTTAGLNAAADIVKSPALVSANMKPAPQQEPGTKTEAVTTDVQPGGIGGVGGGDLQGRQRSWKKRFSSLRTPFLFGRGM